jgi:hypothetical protein
VDEAHHDFSSLNGVMFDKAMTTLMLFPEGKKGQYTVPDGIISLRSGAFHNCRGLTGLYFPQSLLFLGDYSFNCEQLADITVNELNPDYRSIDGVLFDKDDKKTTHLIEFPRNKDSTDYIVPDGIIRITNGAFWGCKKLINIVLPESLEFIGNRAFAECEALKTITLPLSLQYIGERAFESCSNLETVTLSRKTKIGYKTFEGFSGQFIYRD